MRLKANETFESKYVMYHLLLGCAYAVVIVLPGLFIAQYWTVIGSMAFLTVILHSLRSYVLSFFSIRKSPDKPKLPEDLPRVSIIVPSYNEEAVLERTIPTTLALDYPTEKLELVYVYESSCTDRTEDIILRYADQDSRIKAIRRTTIKGGKAAVTNYGLGFATGDIIGIFDADHSLNSDLVVQAVAYLQKPDIGCVRGRCRSINRAQSVIARLVSIERDVVERLGIIGAARMGGFANFGGGHGFFRRKVLEQLGPFNEDILTEDVDLSVKLHLAGYEIMAVSEMQSWEESPIELQSLIHQRRRWARGWMQVWRRSIHSIIQASEIPMIKRLDICISLAGAVTSGLLVAMLPLMIISACGIRTSCFSEQSAFWMWLFVTTAPIVSAVLVWILDRREDRPPAFDDLLYAPLLIPYIVFFFGISWMCLLDEYVLSWPFAYVKTERADEGDPVISVVAASNLPNRIGIDGVEEGFAGDVDPSMAEAVGVSDCSGSDSSYT